MSNQDVPQAVVSIHAPARGATKLGHGYSVISFKFQFTLPRGERPFTLKYKVSGRNVSIHAPARGATPPHAGSHTFLWFQFTLPRGERLHCLANDGGSNCFNSRSREGSDRDKRFAHELAVFQFTLPRGERLYVSGVLGGVKGFQFTLPRGERRLHQLYIPRNKGFNSRSREGSDVLSP